jgi:hypothetical protein
MGPNENANQFHEKAFLHPFDSLLVSIVWMLGQDRQGRAETRGTIGQHIIYVPVMLFVSLGLC